MDMCYDGALVMPSSYAVMDNEEMTYVEGGDHKRFVKNLVGIWNMGTPLRHALKAAGFNYKALLNCAKMSYAYCVGVVAAKVGISVGTINFIVGAVFAVGLLAAGIAMWNCRLFY